MNTTQTAPALSVSLMDNILSLSVRRVENNVLRTYELALSSDQGGSAVYTLIRYRGWTLDAHRSKAPAPVNELVRRLVARMDAAEQSLPLHSTPEPVSMLADAIAAEQQ